MATQESNDTTTVEGEGNTIIESCKPVTDHFEGIDMLVPEAPRIEGAPNFRRLPGFPVFGTGQPTEEAFSRCLAPIEKKYGDEKHIFWVNLRQEPVVYVNGISLTPREPEKMNFHIEVKNAHEIAEYEEAFIETIKKRGVAEFKYYKSKYGEHPDERNMDNEETIEPVESITSLTNIFTNLKNHNSKVEAVRIPINQETTPELDCFDQIVALLKDTSASTPIVFNCQAGISRTTTGMIIAAILKEFQLSSELSRMKGIVPDDILEALMKKKLGLPGIDYEIPESEKQNALMMGEFDVILELIEAYPEAKIAKAQLDKLVDLASKPPRGTGVQNIREVIIESKMTFDVSSDEWQEYLRRKIMNNIERYFYLIVFAMYVREIGPKGYTCTFKQYLEDRGNLKTMIAEGRGKLEWERQIAPELLVDLKEMMNAGNVKENLSKIIKRIYELSWSRFHDLPRGHHKNNSMHKLASKTMFEILPDHLAKHMETKFGNCTTTPDFFDVIGQVAWYEEEVKS